MCAAPAEAVTLARALSKLGWCSRSEARRLVTAGRVTVDGSPVVDADRRVDVRRARIEVDGRIVRAEPAMYLMLNKPRGVVTTSADERGRRTVYDLLPDDLPRLVAVGRLDLDSEGLLLFTNDTRWADRMLDPGRHVDRVYHVLVDGTLDRSVFARAMAGVDAGRGESLRLKSVRSLSGAGAGWLEVVLDEGRNRQIRRVLEACGLDVVRLIRVAIGPLSLGTLGTGGTRVLTRAEKELLDECAAGGTSR
jgi:23S rRNA pseudouridine2605 synthase